MGMTTWVLIWVVSSFGGYQGNASIATATATFHSKESCEQAAKQFNDMHRNTAFCFEDHPVIVPR